MALTAGRVVVVLSFVGLAFGQISNDLEQEIGKRMKDGTIEGLDKFNQTKIPKAEDVEKMAREKCAAQGHESAVDAIKESQDSLKTCIEKQVNASQIQEELDNSPGAMEEVFGKYCRKWPEIYKCTENLTDTVRLCMDSKEQKALNKSLDILNQLQEFSCYKDGDRLAMFVAEGGVECLQEKKTEIQNCINATVGSRFPQTDELSVTSLPVFLFSDEDCADFDTIRLCVNEELEKCKDSTPANVVDAFLKFMKQQMPCKNTDPKIRVGAKESQPTGSAPVSIVSISTMLFAILGLALFHS